MLEYFLSNVTEPAKPATVIKGDSNKGEICATFKHTSFYRTPPLRSKNKLGTCYFKVYLCRSLLKTDCSFDMILSFYVPFIYIGLSAICKGYC